MSPKKFSIIEGSLIKCIFPKQTSSVVVTASMDTHVRIFDCESRYQGKAIQEMDHATDSGTCMHKTLKSVQI